MWYEFDKSGKDVLIKHPKEIGIRWIRNEEVPEILYNPDNNNYLTFVKTDENGTKYYKSDICPSCSGLGKVYLGISDNNDYLCNKCNGSGKLRKNKTYKIHTHEYGKVLEEEYIEKENLKFYEKNGINKEDNTTYVYLGNTYEIKDELKSKGAKFDKDLKWHSKELIEGYPYIKVVVPIKVYPEKSIGFDYGWESGISHKVNHFFDDMIRLIRKANEELNNR